MVRGGDRKKELKGMSRKFFAIFSTHAIAGKHQVNHSSDFLMQLAPRCNTGYFFASTHIRTRHLVLTKRRFYKQAIRSFEFLKVHWVGGYFWPFDGHVLIGNRRRPNKGRKFYAAKTRWMAFQMNRTHETTVRRKDCRWKTGWKNRANEKTVG